MKDNAVFVMEKDYVKISVGEFENMCKKITELSKIVTQVKDYLEEQDQEGKKPQDLNALGWELKLPKFEIPDWLCKKTERCVTTGEEGTGDYKRWNIKECDGEAELVTVSYGLKYGTPASMKNGTCEANFPDDYPTT